MSNPLKVPGQRRAPRRGRPVNGRIALVEVLPDLADTLEAERLEYARRAVLTRILSVRKGHWDGAGDAAVDGLLGFVIASGTMLRRVTAGHREGAELLGPGDLIQPGRDVDAPVAWKAVTECRLAAIDLRVLSDAAGLPELHGALLAAADTRTNTVARQLVVAQWPSVDERLVATMEMLSDRWGVVSPEGILLPGFLTHSVLAPLVGARRPSVTTALKRLSAAGAVRRLSDGRWVLKPAV